ncbi:uncharacterized protein LOC18772884 isoform X1 [Prunus persica]|uniref:uncharacterized protein LOC18772884 isoform X1 n=1 Tax=Prunus persica TaxID=3760 RepID=UPI0009AB3880|nr:uncharacterized protein LOC18772884 isoform X1 [Prunus persica]
MAFIALVTYKFLCFTLALIAVSCCYSAGYAEENPAQTFVTALACFNNKFIYAGCDEAYRLNESGNFNVPPEATDLFCHGPCLAETQQVLNCVDHMLSGFVFNNRATLPDIRGALRAGCSYTSQRGKFNGFGPFGEYIQGETSNAQKLPNFSSFFTFLIVTGCSLFILH